MKKRGKKLFASILSVILVFAMMLGNIGGVTAAKADTSSTDDLLINFFNYSKDSAVKENGTDVSNKYLLFAGGIGSAQNNNNENYRYLGLVKAALDVNGLPQFNYEITGANNGGSNPFSTESGNGTYKGSATVTLTKGTDGKYTYNSKTNSMTFNAATSTKAATVTVGNTAASDQGFWPFDTSSSHDYYFGISFTKSFYVPESSGAYTFTFSGDDDVWVFIDGKLVLDIGGIHGAITGTITLENGKKVSADYKYVNGKVTGANATTALTKGTSTAVSDYTITSGTHTLSFFYFERGAGQSNCMFSYNLIPASYEVEYLFQTTTTGVYQKADEVTNTTVDGVNVGEKISLTSDTIKGNIKTADVLGVTNAKYYKAGYVIDSEGKTYGSAGALVNKVDVSSDASVYKSYISSDIVKSGAKVYVLYDRINYTVEYVNDTDSSYNLKEAEITAWPSPTSAVYPAGTEIELSKPSADNYNFYGWYEKTIGSDQSTNTKITSDKITVDHNIVLGGKFLKDIPTATPTVTPTATPTATPTVTPTATPTVTPTVTPTATPTATPTVTPTATPTSVPIPSLPPVITNTPPVITETPVATTYRVTYVLTDETGDSLSLTTPAGGYYAEGAFTSVAEEPAVDASRYVFSGWSTTDTVIVEIAGMNFFTMPGQNITIYGTVSAIAVPTEVPTATPTPEPTEAPTATPTPIEEIIEEPEIPEAPIEVPVEDLPEEELPLDLPETGTISVTMIYLFAAAFVIAGLAISRKRRRA